MMLKQVFEPSRDRGQPNNLEIVVIPTLGLAQSSDWGDGSGSWLRKLIEEVVPQAGIWEYVYPEGGSGSLARRLLVDGHSFLDALHGHFTKAEHEKRPLVFICHGIGGLVLKKALCISREQHYHYRPVIDIISGAIFLGVPHLVSDPRKAKETLDLLLKCNNKGLGRTRSSDGDVTAAMDICNSFELVNIKVPIVSAYESKATPTQWRIFAKFFGKGRNPVIVTEGLCKLKASFETVVDSEANHFDICKVPVGSILYEEAAKLLQSVLNTAPKAIAERSQPYAVPKGLKDDTLQSPSTAGYTQLLGHDLHNKSSSQPISSPLGATGGSTAGSFEIVPATTALEITTTDPHLPCFSIGIARKMDHFYGREDVLQMIDEYLLPSPQMTDNNTMEQLRSFAICGLGGIGKTELAVEYAYTRREFFDAIFWLSADDVQILTANFAQIAQQLGLEDDAQDLAASRDVVNGWLSQPLRKSNEPDTPENEVPWLIIFDNVDNLDVLSDFWPKTGRGSVLVTSRDPVAKHNIFTANGIALPPLTNIESQTLMERLTLTKADASQREALSAIVEKLGGLPLAINQMSSIFRELRLSYIDFLQFYNEEGIEQLHRNLPDFTDPENARSLATVWALDRLSPKTRALLQVICLLDPDDIPEELLVDKSSEIELSDYPKDRGEYFRARAELLSSSLIQQNVEHQKLKLHRLVQDATKSMMNEGQLFEAFRTAIRLVISAWPFQSLKEHHSIARFSKCEIIFPSVLRLKNGLEPFITGPSNFALDIRVAQLFNDTGWYMFERGLPEELEPFCNLALVIGEKLGINSNEEIMRTIRESHSFLGISTVETNEHDLSLFHKRMWLDMLLERESAPGVPIEDYELGYAYNEIGVAYGNDQRLEAAAQAFIRSIEIFQELPDYEDTMLGWPEPNLGFIYWMQGKLKDAERVLIEILDIHAAAWGVDDTKSFKTGKILYGMGNVLQDMGLFDDSLNFHRRCFLQFKKTLGTNHHRTGDICHKMAGHCMRQGAYADAEVYLNQALKIFSGRQHLINELARTTFKKGALFRLVGDNSKAEETMARAYELRRQLMPRDVRPLTELTEKDFDMLVAFWSR